MTFEGDRTQNAVKELSELIKSKLKDFKLEKHKIIVQVSMFEQKNQGVQVVNKCFWDPKTDFCLTEQFKTDTFTCLVVAYLIHFY